MGQYANYCTALVLIKLTYSQTSINFGPWFNYILTIYNNTLIMESLAYHFGNSLKLSFSYCVWLPDSNHMYHFLSSWCNSAHLCRQLNRVSILNV